MIEVTQEPVIAAIDPADLARIASEARAEFEGMPADEALCLIYIRSAIAEHQSARVAEWMDATRKTVEGFIDQLKDHPMLSAFSGNPFGGM